MTTVLRPADDAQLRDMMLFLVAHKTPVEIVGGGSKAGFGRPVQAAHRLDLSGLAGIDLYEPEELVLSAAAGTPLAEIEAALAAPGQMLAFEPMDWRPLLGTGGTPTLGGTVACNLSGPRRPKMGAARDHFLGVACVGGRGEPFKAGGRVVKNVTGYDLCKLLAGSHGTLAVMSKLTVKVLPAPEDTRTLLLHRLDDARAVAAMTAALNSSHEVSAAAHLPAAVARAVPAAAGAAVTAVRLEGFAPSVAARVEALSAQLAGFGAVAVLGDEASFPFWRAVRDVLPFANARERPVWRLSVPPAAGPAVADAIRAALDADLFYDWGGGLIWASVPADAPDAGEPAIRAAVAAAGGHATLVRAPAAVRESVAVFQPQPAALAALTKRVKDGFDPWGVLNPGRMYAGV